VIVGSGDELATTYFWFLPFFGVVKIGRENEEICHTFHLGIGFGATNQQLQSTHVQRN
jgi:hypothetical protein